MVNWMKQVNKPVFSQLNELSDKIDGKGKGKGKQTRRRKRHCEDRD